MALKYLDSNAAGAGTGADWANAYTTLVAAYAGMAAGDTVYVAHNHAETQASALSATSPGSSTTPCFVICVTSAGTVPPVSADLRTTATITTTGASTMTLHGGSYYEGITFNCGSGAVTSVLTVSGTTGNANSFKNCTLSKIAGCATSQKTPAVLLV